jgi:glucokinase
MANMANGGHQGMKKIFDLVGYTLGLSTANVINTLDLPLYVIGGGVADAWNLFSPALFDAVRDHSYVYRLSAPTQKIEPESGKPFITRAKLGPHAGLIGAAMVSLSATRSTARSP